MTTTDVTAWQAHSGISTLVIVVDGQIWTARGTGLDESGMLREGIVAIGAGEWAPNAADGWELATDGPFDPHGWRGWDWTEVAS